MLTSPLVHGTLMKIVVPQRCKLLDQVKSRESWGADRIRAYQEEKLREMIHYCWNHVPFYRKH